MTDSFKHHRDAALALLTQREGISHRAAGFLGHVAVAEVITPKQRKWLNLLLSQSGREPLEDSENV